MESIYTMKTVVTSVTSAHAHGGGPKTRRDRSTEGGRCRVTELFRILGKAHMLDILHVFHTDPSPHRFVDIQERLHMSPNTLSERLRELVEAGLLHRTSYNEIPPRVDYAATDKMLALAPVFETLDAWATTHDLKVSRVPTSPTA